MTLIPLRLFASLAIAGVATGTSSAALHNPGIVVINAAKFPRALVEVKTPGAGATVCLPLENFGPVLMREGKMLLPGEYETRLVSEKNDGIATRLTYQIASPQNTAAGSAPTFTLAVERPALGKIILTLESAHPALVGAYPGRLAASNDLIGFSVPTRYNEDYARHGRFPDLFYHRKAALWMRARWDLDYGNASRTESPYPASTAKTLQGEDAVFFPGLTEESLATPGTNSASASGMLTSYFLDSRMVYQPLVDGARRPLCERLVFTFSPRLWDAVAVPSNQPSQYREALKNLMYLDIWAGFYADRSAFTAWMQETVGRYIGGLCIVQNWQGGGFDSNLPHAIADELPPSPRMVGTPDQLKSWMEQMKSWGLAGLRTNYQLYRSKEKPLPQTVRRARAADGKPKWHTQPQDVLPVIEKQERYIQNLLGTTASFSDQLTSGGPAAPYVEFSPDNPDAGTIRGARNALRGEARLIKSIVGGPLLSETLNSEFLIGEFVDSGDYGIFEGFNRMVTPDYKLRRLHPLTVTHGMGLGYRYFFGPPYGGTGRQSKGSRMYRDIYGAGSDDYRAMTIAWGNAAYLDYAPGPSVHDKALTEAMTVGVLQRHYLLQPVREITYAAPDSSTGWQTLEELLLAGKNPLPYFSRIKVVYENGLTVIVNRQDDSLALRLPVFGNVILPKHAWAVWTADGAVEGFSGIPVASGDFAATGNETHKEQNHRIDYTRDDHRELLFINPRATGWRGLAAPTIFEKGEKTYELPVALRYSSLPPPAEPAK